MMKLLRYILLAAAAVSAQSMPYLDFITYGKSKDGLAYPMQYTGEGGRASFSLTSSDRITGSSLAMNMTAGNLYAEFNPYNANGSRGFTREYVASPSSWKFNTYNRMEFWIKVPTSGAPLPTNGSQTYQLGTYVKRVANADMWSDETGGNHYYHHFNAPPNNHWTKVIINNHPNHQRGGNGSTEWGVLNHPTGEANYNYFDALTRWYLNDPYGPTGAKTFKLDDVRFYRDNNNENDSLYSISASYEPATHKTFISVNMWKRNSFPIHEFRFSRKDIAVNGWASATQCPGGRISPPGDGGYNTVVYQSTGMTFNVGETIYFAVKPDNSNRGIQISLPIMDAAGGLTTPPVVQPPPPCAG